MELLFWRKKEPKPAEIAKNRLTIIIEERRRSDRSKMPDYLPALQKDILEAVRKYINISEEQEQVEVQMDTKNDKHILEVNIPLPADRSMTLKTSTT